ncbi:hypothetical protein C8R48DRAFT_600391, partial [Suillus tomentosus]
KPFHTPPEGHSGHLMSTAFSPDGGRVVSVLWDQTVWVWDIKIGEASGSLFQGHTDWVWFVTISLSPNIWMCVYSDLAFFVSTLYLTLHQTYTTRYCIVHCSQVGLDRIPAFSFLILVFPFFLVAHSPLHLTPRELEVDELPPISNPLGCELNGSISNFEASNT